MRTIEDQNELLETISEKRGSFFFNFMTCIYMRNNDFLPFDYWKFKKGYTNILQLYVTGRRRRRKYKTLTPDR